MAARNVTAEHDPRDRFGLYRLCECPECGGKGKINLRDQDGEMIETPRCAECRGEGRVRQELAACDSPEAVGVALVTLSREGEWEDCAFGLLDREPPCERCEGTGNAAEREGPCSACKGSGVKPTGTWLVLPWLPSARNVRDAAKLLRAQR